jgi:Flp pilus assembly protein TadD
MGLRTLLADQDKRDALIAEYREVIRRRPNDASAHFILGFALSSGDQPDEAIVEYREAIRIKPDLTPAYVFLAGELWIKGDLGQMVAILQGAVEQKPDGEGIRHRLALAHLLAGDREGYRRACVAAVMQFDLAKGLFYPNVARACLLEPDALDDLSLLRRLTEAVTRTPTTAFPLYILGLAHFRTGLYEQAIQDLTAAMKAEPQWHSHALTQLVLAMAHQRLGNAEEARSWLQKAGDTRGDKARGVKPGQVIGTAAPWWDRGDFQILRREAEGLILKPNLPGGTSAP